jgi:Fe-S oxidoreductase
MCVCPFHLDIRGFLEKAGRKRWIPAYKTLSAATVFPAVVAALCDQPCRGRCQRTVLGDEPIALRDLEAACLRLAKSRAPDAYVIPPKEQRVAVIGAGVSGLACALNLAQKRYLVTVFDQQPGWGGSLRTHPRFAEFDADITLQFGPVDAEFRFGAAVASLDEVVEFDAVYVATGAGSDAFGLAGACDRALFTTALPKVFVGGQVCGATLMEAIAEGVEASKVMEMFLATGRVARASTPYDKEGCGRFLEHRGASSAARVVAAQPEGYTEDEARAEAQRCLQCDCDDCLVACEMLKRFRKEPKKIGVEVFTDMGVNPPLSSRTVTREVYSCNVCGYCGSICPEGVDVGALMQFSREARCAAGVAPAALHDYWLREMDFAATEGAFASAPAGKTTCEYVFFPGCQLGADSAERVLSTYDLLASGYDMGVFLSCCGAPAYWAGDADRLAVGIKAIRQTWHDLGKPTIVLACATCAKLFAAFLPDAPRVSVYELLAGAGAPSATGAAPASPFPDMAVFDPCAARGDDQMQAAVRRLARAAGTSLEELPERNRCCGHGGLMRVANPGLYNEITLNRAAASDKPYLVYCANCREVFASRQKACAHVLDVFLGLDTGAGVPTLEQKRDNSLRVKKELMKRLRDTDFEPDVHAWDGLTLIISADLQRDLDRKLISAADLREAVWLAETSGDVFVDAATGTRLASMVKPVITYWVEYREAAPDTYEVLSAYYHRMRFQQGE